MVKKLGIFFTLFILIYSILFSYTNELPNKSINFIKTYFDYDNIYDIEKFNGFYKVVFNDGISIYFNSSGLWQEVKGNSSPIPVSFIDENVIDTVKKTNPNASIIAIKKRWNMYVISLDNYMNIFIDFAGMLIGQKLPD